jgi:magnesium chelatase family protein
MMEAMLATITSAALVGVEAEPVHVEVSANLEGEPRLILVGLPDAAVKESVDRVITALAHCGQKPFRTRTTINLGPGDLRKEGPMYDLPIALCLLASAGSLPMERLAECLIAGELSLSGATRPVRGALAIAKLARRLRKSCLLVPEASAPEAALVEGMEVLAVPSLSAAIQFFRSGTPLKRAKSADGQRAADTVVKCEDLDFSDLKGQPGLRRAIEVAVAGAHNLLIMGPPGAGKSMAAKRIPSIMPPPTPEEYLEILGVQSIAGKTLGGKIWPGHLRPFRCPHHTVSDAALLGGGSVPGPGEISLAHRGVLFLDELPEFRRSVLQVLRQPLEDGEVSISRRAAKVTFPSAFMLVAAMNPCPCGHLGDARRSCRCTPRQIEHYRSRVGGPLLDRIDLHIEAPALSFAEMRSTQPAEASAAIRERVMQARKAQSSRLGGAGSPVNARMRHSQIREHCALDPGLSDLLQQAMERLGLSARAHDRILKVARTIADLAGAPTIAQPHLLEAIQYRTLDRAV